MPWVLDAPVGAARTASPNGWAESGVLSRSERASRSTWPSHRRHRRRSASASPMARKPGHHALGEVSPDRRVAHRPVRADLPSAVSFVHLAPVAPSAGCPLGKAARPQPRERAGHFLVPVRLRRLERSDVVGLLLTAIGAARASTRWPPRASLGTRPPLSASCRSQRGRAMIAFDWGSTATGASTSRWALAQALPRCRAAWPARPAVVRAPQRRAVPRAHLGRPHRRHGPHPGGKAGLKLLRIPLGEHPPERVGRGNAVGHVQALGEPGRLGRAELPLLPAS